MTISPSQSTSTSSSTSLDSQHKEGAPVPTPLAPLDQNVILDKTHIADKQGTIATSYHYVVRLSYLWVLVGLFFGLV